MRFREWGWKKLRKDVTGKYRCAQRGRSQKLFSSRSWYLPLHASILPFSTYFLLFSGATLSGCFGSTCLLCVCDSTADAAVRTRRCINLYWLLRLNTFQIFWAFFVVLSSFLAIQYCFSPCSKTSASWASDCPERAVLCLKKPVEFRSDKFFLLSLPPQTYHQTILSVRSLSIFSTTSRACLQGPDHASFGSALVVSALLNTDCPSLKLLARGKVRDIYEVPDHPEALLFVATDRVSAFDVIMKNVSQALPSPSYLHFPSLPCFSWWRDREWVTGYPEQG